jgi:hypothetical protein
MQNCNVDFSGSHNRRIGLALTITACLFIFACATEKKPIAEAPHPSPVLAADEPQQMAKVPPPQMNEVQEAVKRVFKETVDMDTSHVPVFIAGDLNGDHSEDIAVVVKPASEKIPELNEESPPWILRDLFATAESRSPRLRIADKDVLLAVIHGYGASGWRDPQATQTFVLKNAVGSGMVVHSSKEFAAANQGKPQPLLRGAVVEEVLDGKSGYLYYAGATYSWYDPKTFKAEPERGMVHGLHAAAAKQ